MKEEAEPSYDDATARPGPGPAGEAGRTLDETREQAGEDLQKP